MQNRFHIRNRKSNPGRNRGMTLLELIITMAVVAVLVAGAAPSFADMLSNGKVRSARSALNTALNQTRMAAVTRGTPVVACPASDQQSCMATTRWDSGWIVFADDNDNGKRESNETVITVAQAQPRGVAIQSTAGRTRVTYRGDGTSGGSNITITLCDQRGADRASSLVISNVGRIRLGTPTDSAATACMSALSG